MHTARRECVDGLSLRSADLGNTRILEQWIVSFIERPAAVEITASDWTPNRGWEPTLRCQSRLDVHEYKE